MELQLAVQSARSNRRHPVGDGTSTTTKAIPNYLKPSTGSCHHACKYGGTHTFDDQLNDAHCKAQPTTKPPRKQPPPPVVTTDQQQKRSSSSSLIRVRLVPRKLFGGRSRGDDKVVAKAADTKEEKKKPAENVVEWKDIAAYGTVTAHGRSLPAAELIGSKHQVGCSGDDVKNMKGSSSRSHDKQAENNARRRQLDGATSQNESLLDKQKLVNKSTVGSKIMTSSRSREPAGHNKSINTDDDDNKSVKSPRLKKKPSVLLVAKKKAVVVVDQELVADGYQPVSPSLLQKRASLLRDLEEEMVNESSEFKTTYSLDQEEAAAAAAETSSRPVPAHRRVKSMTISSRSVRFPFTRQASKNSATTFKLRSKSSKGPPILLPPEEEKPVAPARLRSRRGSVGGGGDAIRSTAGGRGVQLRIRSLRRRGGGDAGFVVPAVALRHQKTLEKKRSQRLYNNQLIEETASKLVKARKSRVKALVGAFESVISRIAK